MWSITPLVETQVRLAPRRAGLLPFLRGVFLAWGMTALFPQKQFARQSPADLAEHRAAALLIAALSAPDHLVKHLARMADATCPPEQPISQIILAVADWLVDQTGPYGDLPWAAPFIPNLRGHLAQSGLAPNLCAALDFAYAATKGRPAPSDDFHADPQDLCAAITIVETPLHS